MEGKSTEKLNLNRINVMQAGRELHDLEMSDREPEGQSSSLTYFWRSSAEAVVEIACSRGAAGLEGSTLAGGPACLGAGEKRLRWGGLLSNVWVRLCGRGGRGLQGSLLGGSRQEWGGTHPLVWAQSAHEREGCVGSHCGDSPTPFLHGGEPVAWFPHMVGSEMDRSLSHLLSSLWLCKWLGGSPSFTVDGGEFPSETSFSLAFESEAYKQTVITIDGSSWSWEGQNINFLTFQIKK